MVTRALSKNSTASEIGFLYWRTPNREQHLELAEMASIGREPGSSIVLSDDFASLRHARIEKRNNTYVLRDLRSRNGTYVNGARILEAVLADGDRISIGQTIITFSWQRDLNAITLGTSSKSPKWNEQLQRLPNVAQSNLPVLLTGPSGAGKELLAHTIHRLSSQCSGPFISVNCSALSESLVESELFGHIKGSFTGATADRRGAFEAGRGGTLFLDEIGDLPLSLQPKLLRALENRQIRPVGSDRNIDTDVRIIAATHNDLPMKVREERFRQDLYYRLNVLQLRAPSLLERMEDFDDLFYHFAKMYRVKFNFAALGKLKTHSWPGNIRELKNTVARAKTFFPDTDVTEDQVQDLFEAPVKGFSGITPAHRGLLRQVEHELIFSRLMANGGNQRRTALELGIPKSTLNDRLKRYAASVKNPG